MEARQATLCEMGLRTVKAIALHILQENTYESNLVSDIANAPYLRGNTGRTHLAPLPGLPPLVDDNYVYGRLEEKDTVRVGGRISCTTGPNGAAARTVSQISLFARAVWPPEEHKWIHVSIANTVATNSGTRIPQTIEGIEAEDEGRLAKTWADIHGGARAAAYFVAKLDMSELPFEALQAGLPQLQRQLVATGMALYQVDYTQDFSGTLDREKLVRHLEEAHHFCYQGEPAKENTQGCNLDNTDSVGNHVCTCVWSTGKRAISTKFYNKFVSQIEAGDVRGQFGGHMSGTVASTNQHLRRTLAHPDVLARGCTRLEISIYGCLVEELDAGKAGTCSRTRCALRHRKGRAQIQAFSWCSPQPNSGRTTRAAWTAAWYWPTVPKKPSTPRGVVAAKRGEYRGCWCARRGPRSKEMCPGKEPSSGPCRTLPSGAAQSSWQRSSR